MSKWPQKSKLRPTRQIIRLSVIQNTRWMKTVTFSHHKSPSQRIDTWQLTDREGTMLSWTKPTLDQLIIRFNASKSINYATPMWNKHIYLTPNSVETNTHVSTLHSTIRKQLSKIGQSTEWHFNTQPPVGVQISLKYSTLKCTRLTSPQYPVRILGISSCHVEPDTVDPNHHIPPFLIKKIIVMIFQIQVHKFAIQHKCKNEIHNGNKSLASY